LRRVGTVLHVSSHGYIIIKAEFFAKIDSAVVTKRMKRVGTVHDVFGQVTSPYISVKPFKSLTLANLQELRGEKVYI
jgi:RNA-binding protein